MSAAKPTLTLRCPGHKPLRMGPGEQVRIGRHASNDLVLSDETVSRFHARISWDPDEDRPFIEDNDSANGIEVDGEPIEERSHLPGGNQIMIGRFTILAEVTGAAPGSGALRTLPSLEESDSVVLFSERQQHLGGHTSNTEELHRVFLQIEEEGRTGTLTLHVGSAKSYVTFAQGLVMSARHEDLKGRDALRALLTQSSVIYSFARELRPAEEPLSLSVRSFLATELADVTRKIVTARHAKRDEPDGLPRATSRDG
jgi:pSer/pThr/pTyr-binding forkhead associated (FHA) protein